MSDTSDLVVGFVGLGQIGRPMAERLVDWPGGLWVHDLAPEPVEALVDVGAHAASNLAELGREADVISLMVRDDEQVRDVVHGLLPTCRSGAVIAIHSTIRPDTAEDLAGLARPHGVGIVDAPVTGGPIGAMQGTLAILVGGDDGDVARCRVPFERMGNLVVHVGPVGAGTRAKLARNLLQFVAFTGVTEAQRLAEAAGIDLVTLGAVVRHSDAVTGGPGAIMHRTTAAPLASDDPWTIILDHVAELGEKDLDHALALADDLGVDTPLARLARQRLRAGLGLPDDEGSRT